MFGQRGDQYNPAEPEELYRRMRDEFYFRAPDPLPPATGQTGAGANGGWIPLPKDVIPFELKADATAPGIPTAYTAYRLEIDNNGYYNIPLSGGVPDENAAIYVFDLTGQIRAPGYTTMHALSAPQNGTRGWAVQTNPSAERPAAVPTAYSIIWIEQPAFYGEAVAASQFISSSVGGSLVTMSLGGSFPGLKAGDGIKGNANIQRAGIYAVMAGMTVGPGATGAGTLATPFSCQFSGAIGQNGPPLFGGSLIPDMSGHFQCLTDPAGTPNWKITVGGTDYNLPGLPSAVGSLSIVKLLNCSVDDQIGLFVQCASDIELMLAYLVLYRIG
jgi:hypothetical protein